MSIRRLVLYPLALSLSLVAPSAFAGNGNGHGHGHGHRRAEARHAEHARGRGHNARARGRRPARVVYVNRYTPSRGCVRHDTDGYISRDEWACSTASFWSLDRNHNGVISPIELR